MEKRQAQPKPQQEGAYCGSNLVLNREKQDRKQCAPEYTCIKSKGVLVILSTNVSLPKCSLWISSIEQIAKQYNNSFFSVVYSTTPYMTRTTSWRKNMLMHGRRITITLFAESNCIILHTVKQLIISLEAASAIKDHTISRRTIR